MAAIPLETLLVRATKAEIYAVALAIAESIGLPVESWQAGDPTRSLYHLESEILSIQEENIVGFIAAGFLDHATGTWLKVLADQVFGVEVPGATHATTKIVLTNNGGGNYPDIQPGDLTFQNSATGKTYRNTTGGALAPKPPSGPAPTLILDIEADDPGSASNAAPGEIDVMVSTSLLGVSCTNPTAAIGLDEQPEDVTRQLCRDKLSSLSPHGPRGIYEYIARTQKFTGTAAVTQARSYGDSETGDVTLYIAGPSGAVTEPDRKLVEAAILEWAVPLCITVEVLSATAVPVEIEYELWIYKTANKTADEVEADVQEALMAMLTTRSIGGDIIPPATAGALYKSMIESTIRSTFPDDAFRVIVTKPAADVPLARNEVPVLGTTAGVVHIVSN